MRSRWVAVIACVMACGSPTRMTGSDASHDSMQGSGSGDAPPANIGQSAVYAHTASSLYRVDPDTYAATKVGDFGLSILEIMTDLAIDGNGNLVGVSFSSVYSIDATTGHATQISSGNILTQFNGL